MKDQKKSGVFISYITIIINNIVSIFLTPFLISCLGISEYGVYQIVCSIAAYLMIVNFGMGTIITRNISKYLAEKDKKGEENFLYMAAWITGILFVMVLLVSGIIYLFLDKIFSNSLTVNELYIAKKIYLISCTNIAITLIINSFTGVLNGYEKFAVNNLFNMAKILLRVFLIFVLLKLGFKAIGIVLVDLFVSILMLLLQYLYSKLKLNIKAKFYYFDKKLFHESLIFSIAIFLQTIVSQINTNLDRVILGVMTTADVVAVYSQALMLYALFSTFTGTISSVFLPQATRMLVQDSSPQQMTDMVIKPGRIQYMIASLFTTGFIIFGKQFLYTWLGQEFVGAYIPTIILFIPLGIVMSQGTVDSILDAMMKRFVRSIILIAMAVLNIILSIIFIRKIGYVGAAIGTAASLFIGHLFIMNLYYYKVIGLDIIRMIKEVYLKTAFSSAIICFTAYFIYHNLLIRDGWFNLLLNIGIYTVIFAVSAYVFMMKQYERELFKSFFNLRKKKEGEVLR